MRFERWCALQSPWWAEEWEHRVAMQSIVPFQGGLTFDDWSHNNFEPTGSNGHIVRVTLLLLTSLPRPCCRHMASTVQFALLRCAKLLALSSAQRRIRFIFCPSSHSPAELSTRGDALVFYGVGWTRSVVHEPIAGTNATFAR